mmetsp:Transcript_17974/g.21999  ORF Transcript_17974/g.21999 Transcript_17974/m.21999 type:complete len:320 (-) Transcript_17974:283-1242(-)
MVVLVSRPLLFKILLLSSTYSVKSFSFVPSIRNIKAHKLLPSIPFSVTRFKGPSYIMDRNHFSSTASSETEDNQNTLPDPSTMRIRAIKDELDKMGVSSNDCFDKDSLCSRLIDARDGKVKSTKGATGPTTSSSSTPTPTSTSKSNSNFDKDEALAQLRSLRVKELRTKCAKNGIRWATMIEKEDLVQALIAYEEMAANFSPSGKISPGKVAMIDDVTLEKELKAGITTTPLLLDVFATWCGPCKLMAPQLDDAASDLGDKVRVAKIDSDEYPEWSGKLNVSGLPTIIIFDGNTGKEIQRVEGALMKDDLVKLALSHVK